MTDGGSGAALASAPDALERIVRGARFAARGVLLESEGLDLLAATGLDTPRRFVVGNAAEFAARDLPGLPGERVVLKALSPAIRHKTELGALRIVANEPAALRAAAEELQSRLAAHELAGFLVCEFVPHAGGPGGEFLLGLRVTRDHGPVVTLGPGGIHAEPLAKGLGEDAGVAIFSPALADCSGIERALARHLPARLANEPQRGRAPALAREALVAAIEGFLALARRAESLGLTELEANPIVVSGGRLVALDALASLGAAPAVAPARPLAKLARLFAPRSIAIAGVSEKLNPGRIILQNVLRAGFPRECVTVLKPGCDAIDGCRCVPGLDDLEPGTDLVVLSVPAADAVRMTAEIAERDLAASVILIPGGLDERPESAPLVERMRQSLSAARARPGGGPVVNGGNCLGVRSVPGRYDTLFIPPHKLPPPEGPERPLALVTGSGAFAVAKASRLERLNARYLVTIGNQTDLTIGDYLEHFAADAAVEVIGVYLEGFRPGDGARAFAAAKRIAARGGVVVWYLAGRSPAGVSAAASHTASVAGDPAVARALARAAGVLLADTLEEFEDLVRLATLFRSRPPRGSRLGAVSNAGFESVALADHCAPLTLAPWSPATREAMHATLAAARLDGIVALGNPIDVTPILGDEGFAAIARAALEDPQVDVAAIGCVPMTGALDTLAAGEGHADDVTREGSVASRLVALWNATTKPWVAVVDAGTRYDAMVRVLEDGGVPTFRSADRAARVLARVVDAMLRSRA